MELGGECQVRKTYILNKFAQENYKTYLYIDMVQITGQEFLECLERATAWEPGISRKEQTLHEAIKLFDGRFQDSKDMIVVIDEIQDSAKVYSLNRQFAREFFCHTAVTK